MSTDASGRLPMRVLERQRLEPAVEVLHGATAVRFIKRDEEHVDLEAQAEANDAIQGAYRSALVADFSAVVELHTMSGGARYWWDGTGTPRR